MMRAAFLLGLVAVVLALPEDTVIIETGVLQGKVTPMARAFRQIPYAKPPVGNLRWQDPQPADKWPGTRQGFVDGAGCIQHCDFPQGTHACPITTSEDCLFLTVYTPRLPIYKNVPVMVFLHGGDFFQGHGGSPLYDGSYLSNKTNVVVVGVNYRLGAMAWLATGSDIKGNYGIRDQIAALQWVQRNIANFGGDPNNVMLFGQSAGAISAAILLTVPSATPLFHRVLMQSEPYTIPLRDKQTMPPVAASFAKSIGCAVSDAACMRGKSADDVLKAQIVVDTDISTDLLHLLNLFLPWTPWVDGDLIPEQPMTALIKGNFPHGMPVIMGNTRGENWIFIYSAFTGPLSPIGYDLVLSAIVGLRNAGKVMAHYPMPPHTADARDHTSLVSTDYVMLCPNRNVTRAMSQYTDVYLFVFDHLASFVEYAWAPNTECYTNVCHASDLPFVFDSGHEFVNYTKDEWTMASSMMDYWAGFAHNGDPNSFKRQQTWPKYVPETSLSMHFQTPANKVDSFFLKADCDFWDTIGYGYGPSGEHHINTEAVKAFERSHKYSQN